jgi:hypothetical protein
VVARRVCIELIAQFLEGPGFNPLFLQLLFAVSDKQKPLAIAFQAGKYIEQERLRDRPSCVPSTSSSTVRDSIPATRLFEVSRGVFWKVFCRSGLLSSRNERIRGRLNFGHKCQILEICAKKQVLDIAPASAGDQKKAFGTL